MPNFPSVIAQLGSVQKNGYSKNERLFLIKSKIEEVLSLRTKNNLKTSEIHLESSDFYLIFDYFKGAGDISGRPHKGYFFYNTLYDSVKIVKKFVS